MEHYVFPSGLHLADNRPMDSSNKVVVHVVAQGFGFNVVF